MAVGAKLGERVDALRVRPESDANRTEVVRTDRAALVLLAAALLLGLVRFVRLGEWSLWIDEALTLSDSLHRSGAKNPLGYWMVGWIVEATGGRPSEWQLRALPALVGWLSIPLAAWAFRPALGARAASCAALFLAVSSWHVYWSQTARFYTLAAFLGLLGGGYVLRGLERGRAWPVAAGLVVASSAALAHPTALLLVGGLVCAPWVAALLRAPSDRRAALVCAAAGGLALVAGSAWMGELFDQWQRIKGGGSAAHFLLTAGYHVTPTFGAAALLGVAFAVLERRRGVLLVAATVAAGFAAALLLSTVARMTSQYVFTLAPWIFALAAAPLAPRPSDGARERPWFAVAVLALVLAPSLASTALYLTVRHGERPRWKEAYAHVFEHRREGDIVFGMAAPVGEHYFTSRRSEVREPVELVYLDTHRAHAPGRWDHRARRAWFVVNHEELEDWTAAQRDQFRRMLREDCRLVARFPLEVESRDLGVWVYLRE